MPEGFWKVSKSTFWSMLFKVALLAMPVVCGGAVAAIKWTYNNVEGVGRRVDYIEATRLTVAEIKTLTNDVSTLKADVAIIKQLLINQTDTNKQKGN